MFDVLSDFSAGSYDESKIPDAKDEQIVNAALLSLLHALWIDDKKNPDWSIYRKEFKFESRDTGADFVARVDGDLQVKHVDKSAAILEVKARRRPRKDPGDHRIEMQESAQMALWIAQEPDSHWTHVGHPALPLCIPQYYFFVMLPRFDIF